jgi:hypothetical protein
MNNKAERVEKWIGFFIWRGPSLPLSTDAKLINFLAGMIFGWYENAQLHISIGSFFMLRKHYCSDRPKEWY